MPVSVMREGPLGRANLQSDTLFEFSLLCPQTVEMAAETKLLFSQCEPSFSWISGHCSQTEGILGSLRDGEEAGPWHSEPPTPCFMGYAAVPHPEGLVCLTHFKKYLRTCNIQIWCVCLKIKNKNHTFRPSRDPPNNEMNHLNVKNYAQVKKSSSSSSSSSSSPSSPSPCKVIHMMSLVIMQTTTAGKVTTANLDMLPLSPSEWLPWWQAMSSCTGHSNLTMVLPLQPPQSCGVYVQVGHQLTWHKAGRLHYPWFQTMISNCVQNSYKNSKNNSLILPAVRIFASLVIMEEFRGGTANQHTFILKA